MATKLDGEESDGEGGRDGEGGKGGALDDGHVDWLKEERWVGAYK